MRIVKVVSVTAVLTIVLGIFLFSPAHNRQMVNVAGDLRDAPNAGNALEQVGYDGNSDMDIPEPGNAARISPAPDDRSKAVPKTREWTVMYYATTKDPLGHSFVRQLLEMKKTGSTDLVNVLVEASMRVKSDDGVISTPTVRMALKESASAAKIDEYISKVSEYRWWRNEPISAAILKPFTADIVKSEDSVDTGDWRRVADFVRWAKAEYPAKRYAFLAYGHGQGFVDNKKPGGYSTPRGKGILRDVDTGNYVSISELNQLMAVIGKVDILVMQSCLMQTAEVAYQMKGYADVLVGSSEIMSSIGYDLGGIVETLDDNPGISSRDLGVSLAKSYVHELKDIHGGGHASVLLMAKFPAFAGKLNAWVDAIIALDDRAAVIAAGKQVIRFDIFGMTYYGPPEKKAHNYSISGDLYDFVRIITKGLSKDKPGSLLARQRGDELMDFIDNELVYKYVHTGSSRTGFDLSIAHGLSIHIPPITLLDKNMEDFNARFETNYWDMPFAKETKWGAFLKWLYGSKSFNPNPAVQRNFH